MVSTLSSSLNGARESSSDLPVLKVRGNHFQVGLQTGEFFRDRILAAIKGNNFFTDKVLSYNATAEGASVYSNYHHCTELHFPEYLDEIRGMAQGAQITYSECWMYCITLTGDSYSTSSAADGVVWLTRRGGYLGCGYYVELFLWNMQFEYGLLLEPHTDHLPVPSCSTFCLAPGDGRTLMAHNEDGAVIADTTSYIIDAEVTPDGSSEIERYTGFCYAGQLCSTAFGYCETAGKVFGLNALFPKTLDTRYVGRNFITRGLIKVKMEDIESFLNQFTCSSGFSYNVATLDGQKVMNFEVSSRGVVATEIKGYNYHFNLYLHSDVPQYSDPSSLHRLSRVKQLPKPINSTDILALLEDTADTEYPIYRTATGPDKAVTIATALFDLPNSKFSIYRGNPSLAQQPVITIQIK